MDQIQEPIQSSSNMDNEEILENETKDRENVHCAKKEDYNCSSELDEHDSKQVRFEKNGENAAENGEEGKENHVEGEEKEEHSTVENNVPETNGVDDEEDDDDKDTPTPSGDDNETEEQEETPTAELDEEDEEESPTTDHLDTTEDSQRDSFAESDLSEDTRPEEDESEGDIIQNSQKGSKYDRISSFSSLSVNVGSTQQDSDSELQISSRASPEEDIGEESCEGTSMDNDENFEEEEGDVEAEEQELNEDESEEKDESKEEREGRLVKQAHLDIALSLDTQEEPKDDDDNDEKPAASEEPTPEDDTTATADDTMETAEEDTMATAEGDITATADDDTMATTEDDTMATAEDDSIATKDKEEAGEESENDVEEETEEAETEVTEKVPEVFVSSENKDDEKVDVVDESEKEEQEETKPAPVIKEDHGEHTKVKELGRIFQDKDPHAKAVYPKEPTTSEKSPVSVRRFKEMFEHGEPLLSPAAYTTASEEEVTSPRPGIVKNLRDLFENPKNFEWKETAKTTAVVN